MGLNYDFPVRLGRIKLPTRWLKASCSITELQAHYLFFGYDFILRDGEGLSYLSFAYYANTIVAPIGFEPMTLSLEG